MPDIQIERNVYDRNDACAEANRKRFRDCGVLVLNVLSSPGSGKTSLIEETARRMGGERRIFVVEGDVETERDAERIRAVGVDAVQIQTHGACHLDAEEIGEAVADVDLASYDLLIIENVGNLICPTAFDLGESLRIVVGSTTEGEDKPVKYPEAYHGADVCVLNKIDLLAHVPFDAEVFEAAARRANGELRIFRTSCTTGEGLDEWCEWLDGRIRKQSKHDG